MPRRKLETFDDFNRALKNKYGIGENSSYKPWLRVQDVKSSGVRSQIYGVKSGRTHHLLPVHFRVESLNPLKICFIVLCYFTIIFIHCFYLSLIGRINFFTSRL